MVFHRKQKEIVFPSLEEELAINNKADVLKTLTGLGLPHDKFIITGSAALTLLDLPRRANDLDVIVHPEILTDLHENGQLANGTQVNETDFSRPGRLFFRTNNALPLGTELFSHNQSFAPRDFENFARLYGRVSPDGLPIMSPDELKRQKERMQRIGPDRLRKIALDLYDSSILADYLQNSSNSTPSVTPQSGRA